MTIPAAYRNNSIFGNALKQIFNNYADVIEGGNTYRGSGTAYKGIPGIQSNDQELFDGDLDSLVTTAAGTTTTVKYGGGNWPTSRWVKNETPGYFIYVLEAAGSALIDHNARRITDWDNTTKTFTVDAFPAATAEGDKFTIMQGFKRIPNQLDINADDGEQFPSGFDRFFHISAKAGSRMPWYGNGFLTYKTELQIRLRVQKFGRTLDEADSVIDNLTIMRSILPRGEHRDSTLVRALIADEDQEPEIEINDKNKIVAVDKYTLIYRVNATFL